MTAKQPEALRLADAMEAVNTNNADSLLVQMAAKSAAAAELRRLHAENEALRHNNMVLTDALWKACGDNAEAVMGTIESVGGLK